MVVYHFVYETTNLINGKKYLGKHSTKNLNDNYLGSGTLLKRAVAFHGNENFRRSILKFFDSAEEACQFETSLVTEHIVKSDEYYNLLLGGGNNDGNARHFLANLTPKENSLKAAKTLKSRPQVLKDRNLKIAAKAKARPYDANKIALMNATCRGTTKDTNDNIKRQIQSRKVNHLRKMNLMLSHFKNISHLPRDTVCQQLNISKNTYYRALKCVKLNKDWG